jgi:hypothetical protein
MPATIIFSALLAIILFSSSRTTYRLAPAPKDAAQASVCNGNPPPSVREAAPVRSCPWPARARKHWPEPSDRSETENVSLHAEAPASD